MSQVLYDAPSIGRTTYDPESKIVLAVWLEFSGHTHLRPCVETHVKAALTGARFLIIDVSQARGVPSQADQQWFVDYVFPKYTRAGLKALINIEPANALTKLGSEQWRKTASTFSFGTYSARDLSAALTLIDREYRVSATAQSLT
jgi:hypothetical protein